MTTTAENKTLLVLAMPIGEAPPDGLKGRAFPHIACRRVPTGSIRRTTPTNLTTNNDYLNRPAFPLSRNERRRRVFCLPNQRREKVRLNSLVVIAVLTIASIVYGEADSLNVRLVGHFLDDGGTMTDMQIQGDYLYITDEIYGLRILDLSDPAYPSQISYCDAGSDEAQDVFLEDSIAYVAYVNDGKIRIINIENKLLPWVMSSNEDMRYAYSVCKNGNTLYSGGYHPPIALLDITDSFSPALICSVDFIGGYQRDMVVNSSYLYSISYSSGLHIFDITDSDTIYEVSSLPTDGYKLRKQGDFIYMVDRGNGLRIIYVVNPLAPVEIGYYEEDDNCHNLKVSEEYAYIAISHFRYLDHFSPGFWVCDISEPGSPTKEGYYIVDYSGNTRGTCCELYQEYLYLGTEEGELYVFDVSEFEEPGKRDKIAVLCNGIPSFDSVYEASLDELKLLYQALRANGIRKSDIRVLNTDGDIDLDGDGLNDISLVIDGESEFRTTLTEWAVERSDSDTRLFTWISGHGSSLTSRVRLYTDSYMSSEFAADLDNYKTATSAGEIYVLVSSCFSGKFIEDISTYCDLLITSSSEDQFDHYLAPIGSFTTGLARKLKMGYSFGESFDHSAEITEELYDLFWILLREPQHPLLDDNQDGIGHRFPLMFHDDGVFAMSRYFSLDDGSRRRPTDVTAPEIVSFDFDTSGGDSLFIHAQITSDEPLDSVIAFLFINDSSLYPASEDSESRRIIDIPFAILNHTTGENYYGSYPDTFSAEAINCALIALDTAGNFSNLAIFDTTGIEEQGSLPQELKLYAYPNPFNSAVAITAPEGAEIEIFDIEGRKIGEMSGGDQVWKPEPSVGSGVYLVRAMVGPSTGSGTETITKRVVYLK